MSTFLGAYVAMNFSYNEGLAPMAIEKNRILGGVLELRAKQHSQFSPFARFLGKWAKLAVPFGWLLQNDLQDFNFFPIMFYYIISTTYQKIGDLFCPVHISGLSHSVKYLHSPCSCDVTLAVIPSAFWVEIVKTNAIIAIITSSTMLPMAIFTLDIFA